MLRLESDLSRRGGRGIVRVLWTISSRLPGVQDQWPSATGPLTAFNLLFPDSSFPIDEPILLEIVTPTDEPIPHLCELLRGKHFRRACLVLLSQILLGVIFLQLQKPQPTQVEFAPKLQAFGVFGNIVTSQAYWSVSGGRGATDGRSTDTHQARPRW